MRHTIAENINVLGKFDTSDTVTISLYKISDESVVGLDSNVCNEIASSGVFKWNSSVITTAPTVFTEYLWIMDNNTYKQYGKIVLGGYPDDIKDETDKIQTGIINVKSEYKATGFATENPPSQTLADYKATGFATQNPPSQNLVDYKATGFVTPTELATQLDALDEKLNFIKDVNEGKWEITSNQMIFYKSDNVTEIARFNLFNKSGAPSMTDIFKRELV